MATLVTAADIEKAIRALTTAQKTNLGIEVTLPVAYGDGELATIVVERDGADYLVHDAGFSAMRLTAAGIAINKAVSQRLGEFAQRYRCSFVEGRVAARAASDDVPQVICLVANASRAVADYAYEIRRHAEQVFRVAVFERIRSIAGAERIRETEAFRGRSGRIYRVPIILDQTKTRPQNFLAMLANRQAVPINFAMFYDLGSAYPQVERDAVYDDASDIREEDRSLLVSAGAQVISLMDIDRKFREIVRHG